MSRVLGYPVRVVASKVKRGDRISVRDEWREITSIEKLPQAHGSDMLFLRLFCGNDYADATSDHLILVIR